MGIRRLKEKDIRNDRLQRWLAWFDKDSPEGLVGEVVKMDTAIQKAEEKMEYVCRDKEALRAYQMREMAMSDWTSGLNHAREEGILEGRQEGIRKGRLEGSREKAIEIARNLKGLGEPEEHIANATGLSVGEIG